MANTLSNRKTDQHTNRQRQPFMFGTARISQNARLRQARWFSVRELPWCAPKDSPVRRRPIERSIVQPEEQREKQSKVPIDRFGIIVAVSKNYIIGIDGDIPWKVPADRKLFKDMTAGKTLIIGRRTFVEHPSLLHINHCKRCVVVSKSMAHLHFDASKAPDTAIEMVPSLSEALSLANESTSSKDSQIIQCWVAGGEKLYEEALKHPSLAEIHISEIDTEIPLSTIGLDSLARFPAKYRWDHKFSKTHQETIAGGSDIPGFTYSIYTSKRSV